MTAEIKFEILNPDNVRADLDAAEWRPDDYDTDQEVRSVYLGSVLSLYPSGKYYTPWAGSNLEPCPDCEGSGHAEPVTCEHCNGSGVRQLTESETTSPYWVRLGSQIGDYVDCRECTGGLHTPDCETCGGLGSEEAYDDQVFGEQLEAEAEALGLSVESGEGDPCDVFLSEYRDKPSDYRDFQGFSGHFANIREACVYVGAATTDRNYWRDYDPEIDGSIELSWIGSADPESAEYFAPDLFSGSDYSGSLVEMSNYAEFLEEFEDHKAIVEYYGGHGTYGFLLRIQDVTPEMLEMLASVQDYPLLSEDRHSEMEIEAQDANWESWAESDFRHELSKRFEDLGDQIEDLDADKLYTLFGDTAESIGEYWVNEQSDQMYIDTGRIAAAVDPEDLRMLLDDPQQSLELSD